MKHLKAYTYEKISYQEFKEVEYHTIPQKDIDIISNSISEKIINTPDPNTMTGVRSVNSVYIENSSGILLHILGSKDEWFYILHFTSNLSMDDRVIIYKCDQTYGAIDCLKQVFKL